MVTVHREARLKLRTDLGVPGKQKVWQFSHAQRTLLAPLPS